MSSDEELHDLDDHGMSDLSHAVDMSDSAKRRKVLRACDVCRRKKIRCDAHTRPNTRCTHCTTYKLECTFVEGAKKRGPPKGYVDDLEKRCRMLEDLVRRVAPHVDLEDEVGPSFTKDTWAAIRGPTHSRHPRTSTGGLLPPKSASTPMSASAAAPQLPPSPHLGSSYAPCNYTGLPHENDTEINTLDTTADLHSDDDKDAPSFQNGLAKHIENRLEELSLSGFQKRFHGKSSGVTLVQVAMSLKEEVVGSTVAGQMAMKHLRPKFWRPNPWEWMTSSMPDPSSLTFPPEDLADELVEHAFRCAMTLFPLVHRPTLEKQYKSGVHLKNINVARVYLMVCAVGAKYTNDERAFLKNEDGEIEWASAGWMYFSQVLSMKRPILAPAGLSDLQVTGMMCIYLQGTSAPHASWLIAGIGLRCAQDIGAHREKVYGSDHPFENQLWKRVFWSLVALDRISSTSLGRPVAIFDEDIDAELPLEVDDEYYDEVKKEWKQPEGVPARMTGFVQYVKLQGILAYAIRTVYSINKSKVHLGFVGPEWESHTVAELDSALNSWLDSVPDHLKWDPNMPDDVFYEQAALLRLTYHYVQITIHRPFIPVLSSANARASPLSFPSLAICTNAARAASHILEQHSQRGYYASPFCYLLAFTAGTVLLISIWGVKKSNLHVDLTKQVEDVHRCIRCLHKAEKRWHSAGRLCDIMTELASVNNVPVPQATPTPPDTTRKREREDDTEDRPSRSSTFAPSSRPSTSSAYPASPVSFSSPSQPPSTTFPYQQLFKSPQMQSASAPPHVPSPAVPLNNAFVAAGTTQVPLMPWGAQPATLEATSVDDGLYHIGGMDIPGMNTTLSRSSGFALTPGSALQQNLSPTGFFQEFLGAYGAGAAPDPTVSSEFWSYQTPNDWSWMNDVGLFNVAPAMPGSNPQAPPQ